MPWVNYSEGDWFAVRLRDGGFAVGVIARASPDAALLGYFFGPRHDEVPTLADVVDLRWEDAVFICRFSHLGLIGGSWPILGQLEDWDRIDWPIPVFVRYEVTTGRSFWVYYDDDLTMPLREKQVTPGLAEQGPGDDLMSPGLVEKRLTRLLHH